MSKALSVAAVGALLLVTAPAPAQPVTVSPPLAAGAVRYYFDALRRLDDGALQAMTAGQATSDTRDILVQIREQARRANVKVELQLADLSVTPMRSDGDNHIEAWFDMQVIAKKWFFSKVARELRGRATFYFGDDSAGGDRLKITGIKLDLY